MVGFGATAIGWGRVKKRGWRTLVRGGGEHWYWYVGTLAGGYGLFMVTRPRVVASEKCEKCEEIGCMGKSRI